MHLYIVKDHETILRRKHGSCGIKKTLYDNIIIGEVSDDGVKYET